ncbi:MAG: DNA methyltransferase, partial [Spirochaetota bacterium]
MGALHDELRRLGYEGHPLELLLVRLMFCFFADDTGIFQKDQFSDWLEIRTREDGSDLGSSVAEAVDPPWFDAPSRAILLHCARFNGASVSPAIFGSLFQSVMEARERRSPGAHYTSEKNILKTIHGLFLDEMSAEFEAARTKRSERSLKALLERIATTRLLDPACGCGNFLILAYRELRRLEIIIHLDLRALSGDKGLSLDIGHERGITVDHRPSVPLASTPGIVQGNALRLDWKDIVAPSELSYILGNPPFVGAKMLHDSQRADVENAIGHVSNYGLLDLVAAWYIKAIDYIQGNDIGVAFVSTNSITQGEQVGVLWRYLLSRGAHINFAHRTFKWTNEARGAAAVYCVIIGFALKTRAAKDIFDYPDIKGEAVIRSANNIN